MSWVAAVLFSCSLLGIAGVFFDKSRVRRSVLLLLLFALMLAELMVVIPLGLGGLANLGLLFWVIGHFWLMGRFDR